MLKYTNMYSFMDLLKDNGFVPKTDQTENRFVAFVNAKLAKLYRSLEQGTMDYDYMDLLHDKGYVPANDNILAADVSNDNVRELVAVS